MRRWRALQHVRREVKGQESWLLLSRARREVEFEVHGVEHLFEGHRVGPFVGHAHREEA